LKRKEKVGGKEAQQRLVRWIGPAHQQTNNAALQPNLMPSQQNFFSVQACQIDMSDDCEIKPNDAHELASRQAGGSNFSVCKQACQIDMSDDCGIRPKDAHELASRQAGGSNNLSYTRIYHKNYLRTKRQRNIIYGEAGSILSYFQKKATENPSFYSAMQLDCDEKITNMF
jgi:hypothetical protein